MNTSTVRASERGVAGREGTLSRGSEYRMMVARILTALVGASVITSGMLLGMHEVTKRFTDDDTTRYFRIIDFIPAPDGPRRPTRPPPASAPPERPQLPYDRIGDARLSLDPPALGEGSATTPRAEPDLAIEPPGRSAGEGLRP